jgi:hypothetical protein
VVRVSGGVRVTLTERQLQALVRAMREALAGDLLRSGEVADVHEVLALLDGMLPPADDRHPDGVVSGRVVLREEVLRLLAAAEDEGRRGLTLWQLDDRLTDTPAGTSIQRVVDELVRERLIVASRGDPRWLSLMPEGRARARRLRARDLAEHHVEGPEQLLDLIYRAAVWDLLRGEYGVPVREGAIWHEPTVQGCAGLDADQCAALAGALEVDGLIAAGSGSYRTITPAGWRTARDRFATQRPPDGPLEPPWLLPPERHPKELIRRREDYGCPQCGTRASWLRTRKGKRYGELRAVGLTEHTCSLCSVCWIIYAEPVDRSGAYDPFGDPAVCRPRWAYRHGSWNGDQLAPPDHWPAR